MQAQNLNDESMAPLGAPPGDADPGSTMASDAIMPESLSNETVSGGVTATADSSDDSPTGLTHEPLPPAQLHGTATQTGETKTVPTSETVAEDALKLCCICGLDVSQKKRSRDRSGRYWCLHCHQFELLTDKTATSVACPDCARETRRTTMVDLLGAQVCPSCHQIYLEELKNRQLHKDTVTADPEVEIRQVIRKMIEAIAAAAAVSVVVTVYHLGWLYFRPRPWVPFLIGLYAMALLALGAGANIGWQYIKIWLRKRARRAAYDVMVQAAANQVLALDEDSHIMGISEPPEPLRRRVERAVSRLEACAGLGLSGAGEILETLSKKADGKPLIALLLSQRPNTTDTVARNREIATVAYLQHDLGTAMAAVTAILIRLQYDQEAMTRQALICFRTGELEKAKKIFRRVVHIAREKNSEMDLAAAYCNLGMLHLMLSEWDDASNRYAQAMTIYTRLKKDDGVADCLLSLGLIAYRQKKGAEVEKQLRRALEINKRLRRREGQAICCSLLGLILSEKDEPELKEAEKLQSQAVQLNLEVGRPGGVATAYGNLGLLRVKRGDYAGARDLLLEAQSIYQRINRPKMLAKIQEMLRTVGGLSAAKAARK